MFGLDDTRSRLNFVNLDYNQSVAERHPNFLLKYTYLEDLDNADTFNIRGVDGVEEGDLGKVGVYFNTVITYKTPFVVNAQLVIISLSL